MVKKKKKKKRLMPRVERKELQLGEIKSDPYGEALSKSDQMRPYIELFAAYYSKDAKTFDIAHEKIAVLPLKERYIWRIVQALDWGFADFDSATVRLDREALSGSDRKEMNKVLEEVQRTRTVQFCLYLQELYGPEHMKKVMDSAIEQALVHSMAVETDENEEVN